VTHVPVSTDIAALADELEDQLADLATPGRAENERRYLRSDLTHLGTAVPTVRRTVASFDRQHPQLRRAQVLALASQLWDHPFTAPVHERRLAAVELLARHLGQLGVVDAPLLERLLRESRTWALVDALSIQVVGALVLRDDADWVPVLRRWAADDDRWVRRAALLAHLPSLRRGERHDRSSGQPPRRVARPAQDAGDHPPPPSVEEVFARFGELADGHLEDRDPFVRKAIGWVLRETGARHPRLVTDWLIPRAGRASGVTFREAVRRLPEADRDAMLAARG
jgi:3-methyladenine DNA glycosylase AlkD